MKGEKVKMSQVVSLVEDFAEIAVTIILVYVAYKIAVLIDTLTNQLKAQKQSAKGEP